MDQVTAGSQMTDYNFDAADRLANVTLPNTTAITYGYNVDGQRVKQTVGSQVTNYLWDGAPPYGDAVLETNGSGTTLASYVLGGTDLLSQTRNSATSYYLHDGQGSVRGLTNSAGNITDTYSYTAFGEVYNQTGTTTNSYLYAGQQFDSDTGLYSLRARYYESSLGRFISRDIYSYNFNNPFELNRYVYTANNPINAIDPTGYQTFVEYAERDSESAEEGAVLEPVGEEFASEAETLVDEFDWDALSRSAGDLGEDATSMLQEEANITINGIRSQRVLIGDPDKIAVIGRTMVRVESFAEGLGAETWGEYVEGLSDAENLASNRVWAERIVKEGYTIYDIGLDPKYTSIDNFEKGIYYEMETHVIFGDP